MVEQSPVPERTAQNHNQHNWLQSEHPETSFFNKHEDRCMVTVFVTSCRTHACQLRKLPHMWICHAAKLQGKRDNLNASSLSLQKTQTRSIRSFSISTPVGGYHLVVEADKTSDTSKSLNSCQDIIKHTS